MKNLAVFHVPLMQEPRTLLKMQSQVAAIRFTQKSGDHLLELIELPEYLCLIDRPEVVTAV